MLSALGGIGRGYLVGRLGKQIFNGGEVGCFSVLWRGGWKNIFNNLMLWRFPIEHKGGIYKVNIISEFPAKNVLITRRI